MKIENIQVNIQGISKPGIEGGRELQKGQSFIGRVVSFEDGIMNIRTLNGVNIKAFAHEKVTLPSNSAIRFEVVENTKDMLTLKPAPANIERMVTNEDIMAGFLDSMGVKPDAKNVNFLKDGGFLFGKNLEKLMSMLEQGGREEMASNLKSLMVKPGELEEYIKGFNGGNGEKLIKALSELLQGIRNDETASKMYSGAAGNILKGLFVQINHDFPLFFIPVPMYINNEPYNGEVWIEKDYEDGEQGREDICIYIMVDTPSMGRIETNIRSSGRDLSLNLYCKKELVELFDIYSPGLKKHISNLGFNVRNLGISELKEAKSFLDLAKKYTKPFVPIDVKV